MSSATALLVDSSMLTPTTTQSISFLTGLSVVTSLNDKDNTMPSTIEASEIALTSTSASTNTMATASTSDGSFLNNKVHSKLKWILSSFIICSVVVGSL